MIVERHADEAAVLWSMRDGAVFAPHLGLRELHRLDRRIDANLHGVRLAGTPGVKLALGALEHGDAGEVFAAGVLALESNEPGALERVIAATSTDDNARGLEGALAWVEPQTMEPACKALLSYRQPVVRRALLLASAARGRDPGSALDAALIDDDPTLRTAGLRAIGELRRTDRRSALRAGMLADEVEARFWAGWSASALGDSLGGRALSVIARRGGRRAESSATFAALSLDHDEAFSLATELVASPSTRRAAIRAATALGDRRSVTMLVGLLGEPSLSRLAADGITTITGMPVEGELACDAPIGFTSGPNDDPDDEDVSPDPDEHLRWPAAESLSRSASRFATTMQTGVRYLHGRPIDRRLLRDVLRDGRQLERARVAFELLLGGDALFDVAAPTSRQRRLLEMGTRERRPGESR